MLFHVSYHFPVLKLDWIWLQNPDCFTFSNFLSINGWNIDCSFFYVLYYQIIYSFNVWTISENSFLSPLFPASIDPPNSSNLSKRLLHYYNKLKQTHFLLLRLIGISLILINSSNTIFDNGKYFFLLLNLFVNRCIVLRPPVYHRPFTIFISN